MTRRQAGSYGQYLKIEELTGLQECLSEPERHDELLFIVIHQVYELWFKLMLHEAETARDRLASGDCRRATKVLRRLIEIERVLVQQVAVLETMTPVDFLEFRSALSPASGLQSAQFRELEFLSGMKDPALARILPEGSAARRRLERRLAEGSLADALDRCLERNGFALAPAGEERRTSRLTALATVYRRSNEHADLYLLCETMIEYDENFRLWRQHHVLMVERMIGAKTGTGGTEGVAYLQRTLGKKMFPELWEVRSLLGEGDAGG
jgi:tryptophan 2,3-dioxygenase